MVFNRNWGKNIRRVMGFVAGLMIFIGITDVLNVMYVDRGDDWYRILWHQFYTNQGKIDNLYLGSSHVYYDINPQLLDQMSKEHNFNLATPAQLFSGSYYLLQEADRTNELSHVYLEMYYIPNLTDELFRQYHLNWQNTDHMRISPNKIAYMFSIGEPDQYINILFPYSRYRKYLGDRDYIRSRYSEKTREDYCTYQSIKLYEDGNGRDVVKERGFRGSTRKFVDSLKLYEQKAVLEEYSMGKKSKKYIGKIIEYCQKREIPVTLFASPINDLQLISTENYDDYISEIRKLAAEYGVLYYDFNLAKEEYLPLQGSENYKDAGHMNEYGANLFTPFLYKVLEGDEADNRVYFYNSYEEKLREIPPAVYGIYYRDVDEASGKQEKTRLMCVAANRGSDMEYRITMQPDGGEMYIVQDFSENKKFFVPMEEEGICTITARMKAFPNETVQTMEILY